MPTQAVVDLRPLTPADAGVLASWALDSHFCAAADWTSGPDYRNRGVASALIVHALRTAANQGYDRASLQVESANSFEAFGVYEKAGFTPNRRNVRWALDV